MITSAQTIKAIAVDAAGNPSAVGTFSFTIGPAPIFRVPPPPAATNVIGAIPVVSAAPASLRTLSLRSRLSAVALRSGGLRVTVTLRASAHVLRVRVFRAGSNGRPNGRALLTVFRVPPGAGTYRVTLRQRTLLARMRPGRYVVEAAAGDSRALLGRSLTRGIRITR